MQIGILVYFGSSVTLECNDLILYRPKTCSFQLDRYTLTQHKTSLLFGGGE
jgi:hypothetical protein